MERQIGEERVLACPRCGITYNHYEGWDVDPSDRICSAMLSIKADNSVERCPGQLVEGKIVKTLVTQG